MSLSFVQTSPSASKKQSHAAALSILLSPGLLIIDHIHFQYNGFLYGILILSIVLARKDSSLLASGVVFAALLCLKHIYLYLAPAYFVYLLRAYCLGPQSIYDIRFFNCIRLGLAIGVVAALAFGPFVYYEQIPQVMSRLFPFSRGLCHAYWAPNVWAMYSFTDRVLILSKFVLILQAVHVLTMSSRAISEVANERGCSQQRDSRPRRRHIFRRTPRHFTSHDFHPHLGCSDCKLRTITSE